MHLTKVEIEVDSLSDPRRLWPIADIHLMTRGCHEDLLMENVKRIQEDDSANWLGLGDMADLISYQDVRRFDPEMIRESDFKAVLVAAGTNAVKRLDATLWPIAHKCIGLGEGNHEDKFERRFEQHVIRSLLDRWNDRLERDGSAWRVPFLGYCAFLDLTFRRKRKSVKFRICTHHGAGYAQTKGGKLNRLVRFMQYFEADLYLMGHVHTVTDDSVVQITADEACEHLTHKSRTGAICGTYLRTYVEGAGGYGERAMFEPAVLGTPIVTILPETREIGITKPR